MVAAAPARGSLRVIAEAAAARARGVKADSTQVPMLIGEVTLNTRSMLMNRAGRPRSCTTATIDRLIAPTAPAFAPRAGSGGPEPRAPAARAGGRPASPPGTPRAGRAA